MKIHVESDLNLDFICYGADPATQAADLIVLPGNLWRGGRSIPWARNSWPDKRIIFVPGTIEYFHGKDYEDALTTMRESARDARVDLLQNDELILDSPAPGCERTRILGTTLWTDFRLHGKESQSSDMAYAMRYVPEYRHLRMGERLMRPQDTADLHAASVAWLSAKLDEPFIGHTIVVTHHAPSMRSIAPRHREDPASASCASSLERLVEKCNLWIHGHSQDSFDYECNGARVICNPRGRPRSGGASENWDFQPVLLINTNNAIRCDACGQDYHKRLSPSHFFDCASHVLQLGTERILKSHYGSVFVQLQHKLLDWHLPLGSVVCDTCIALARREGRIVPA